MADLTSRKSINHIPDDKLEETAMLIISKFKLGVLSTCCYCLNLVLAIKIYVFRADSASARWPIILSRAFYQRRHRKGNRVLIVLDVILYTICLENALVGRDTKSEFGR